VCFFFLFSRNFILDKVKLRKKDLPGNLPGMGWLKSILKGGGGLVLLEPKTILEDKYE
jgi:hypothetical protein